MSEWFVEVVTVGNVSKHPNADTLSVTQVHDGYPVVFKTGELVKGQKAIYVPVCSIVPDTDEWSFMRERRVKAKKIRGVVSQGLLVPVTPELAEKANREGVSLELGELVDTWLGITKWEPEKEQEFTQGGDEEGPEGWELVKYTDIKSLKRYKNVLSVGTSVVITEKIHGTNARFCWDGERLWVGSRNRIIKEDPNTLWWKAVSDKWVVDGLKRFPNVIFFGEIYGKGVQDLPYGLLSPGFTVFDTFDVVNGRYNDWYETVRIAREAGFSTVPTLYEGLWGGFDEHKHLAEGPATCFKGVDPAFLSDEHVREGFVVRPMCESYRDRFGRVILKLVGDSFLLRKD